MRENNEWKRIYARLHFNSPLHKHRELSSLWDNSISSWFHVSNVSHTLTYGRNSQPAARTQKEKLNIFFSSEMCTYARDREELNRKWWKKKNNTQRSACERVCCWRVGEEEMKNTFMIFSILISFSVRFYFTFLRVSFFVFFSASLFIWFFFFIHSRLHSTPKNDETYSNPHRFVFPGRQVK